jgi:hypothetical protein
MKKFYLTPEVEILEIETTGFLATSGIPGEEGGENPGKIVPEDELDDLLG